MLVLSRREYPMDAIFQRLDGLTEKQAAMELLTVKQAAARLSVSPALCYALCARGKLRHARIGLGRGTIRIPEDAVAELIRASTVTQPAPREEGLKHIRLPS